MCTPRQRRDRYRAGRGEVPKSRARKARYEEITRDRHAPFHSRSYEDKSAEFLSGARELWKANAASPIERGEERLSTRRRDREKGGGGGEKKKERVSEEMRHAVSRVCFEEIREFPSAARRHENKRTFDAQTAKQV